ncbi:hypothetical protein KOR42_30370 [Thalassoglobus neptunius]|uniref:DUF5666 domain-containing protein n=1 Tax=Thalassoglobus neptunius TaxID=1938619 RepID=A0A5C5WPW6_9PLAN|nr:hypothetical protein [Thalassoglobus neptunius]TWT52169.1 hypothetical protein KOR42_30370 [Thalassoglobus neptunius]
MKTLASVILLVSLASSTALGQVTTYSTYTLHPVQGTVKSVSRNGIIMEKDGKTGPIPMTPKTTVRVEGVGDPGFVRPGAVITVNGVIAGKAALRNASVTVHLSPQQTARQQTRTVRQNASEMTITGVIVNMNPLTINATDLLRMEVGGGNVGVSVPPVSPGKILVDPNQAAKQRVSVVLGSTGKFIQPGDTVTYYYTDKNPKLAHSVVVRKAEPLESAKIYNTGGQATDEKKETEDSE